MVRGCNQLESDPHYPESDSPKRKAALRRRIKTVMQELMFKAARIISHARGWVLGLSSSDSGFAVFERAHAKMRAAERPRVAKHRASEFTECRKRRFLRGQV